MSQKFYLHLVSDSTGSTLHGLARACLVQFDDVDPIEKFWNLVRSERRLDVVLEEIEKAPGPVLYSLVDKQLRRKLKDHCRRLKLPCIAVLDPIMKGMSAYLGKEIKGMPGLQHQLNEAYFDRVDAVDFAIHHDDAQSFESLDEADVILVGVSRTSKTPTCMYLANRGVRAANIPLTPNANYPDEIFNHKNVLYVGLTEKPERLVEIRKNRLKADGENAHLLAENHYLNSDEVMDEVKKARRFFMQKGWPVIDVTKRSVEETAAEVITLLSQHNPELMVAPN